MNTRSVRNKGQFVKDYIDDNSIDIVALTETWLSDGEVLNDLTNGGYSLFIYRVRTGVTGALVCCSDQPFSCCRTNL